MKRIPEEVEVEEDPDSQQSSRPGQGLRPTLVDMVNLAQGAFSKVQGQKKDSSAKKKRGMSCYFAILGFWFYFRCQPRV